MTTETLATDTLRARAFAIIKERAGLVLSVVVREDDAAEFFKKEGLTFDCPFKASEFRAAP